MSEIAELTVLINGDVSGLTEAVRKAQSEIESISTYAAVGYGDGKFSNARKRYNGWENSGKRSIDDRIQWWQNAMNVYSYDPSVYWEARRNIYELEQSRAKDANNVSESYIKHRDYFASMPNGTEKAIGTFGEYKNLNAGFLSRGLIDMREYNSAVFDFGKQLYEGRAALSEKWLKHEEKYNGLTADDYIAGLNRMGKYTQEYYDAGLIDFREYNTARQNIQDEIFDKTREKYAAEYANWQNDADTWYEMRNTFGDWGDYDDSPTKFFNRKLDRIKNFYDSGKISFDEYTNESNRAKMDLYNAQSAQYDLKLKEYAAAIKQQKDAFSKQEQTLKDSWTVSDRKENMQNLRRDIGFYENSVTERGKEKLSDLKTELRTEERNQKLYELQQHNSAVIDAMQKKYDIMESGKDAALKSIMNGTYSITQIESGIQAAVDAAKNSIASTNAATYQILSSIYGVIRNMSSGSSYTDSRTISINSSMSQSDIMKIIGGSFVSGLGRLNYNGRVY